MLTPIDIVPIRRAIISVTDKTGIVELARTLHDEFHIEIISTGGTAKTVAAAGVPVVDIASVTGFPEMMDGRVKTLHPAVHGALLAVRDDPHHLDAMAAHGIKPVDLLIVNLYAFEKTVKSPDCTLPYAIENIDIGGPSMIRSAAKNYRSVAVVTDPVQYPKLLEQMRRDHGATTARFRLDLAMWAFARTASYDAAIHEYLAAQYFAAEPNAASLQPTMIKRYEKVDDLRYGENPHQAAALYTSGQQRGGIASARQLHGKKLSYINLLDANAAFSLVGEFDRPAAAVIKHANPCGCAVAAGAAEAFDLAYAGDPQAAFGGIVAVNTPVDAHVAQVIVAGKKFLEVLIAPDFTADALAILRQRWVDCRLLAAEPQKPPACPPLKFTDISGGVLVQQADSLREDVEKFSSVATVPPTPAMHADLLVAWRICKHVKSNAIVIVRDGQLLGVGAGQMSRLTSCRLAVDLARQNGHMAKLAGAVAASDAFFPFADGPKMLIDAGIKALIQPGGSRRDSDTVELCNQHNVAMLLTGVRHFLH